MTRADPRAVRPLKSISAFITKGATPTTYGFRWETAGVPFLRSECVSDHGLDLKQAMFISPEADAALQRSRVREGDILMTITGYVGRVIRLRGFRGGNINQHIARIRINDAAFDPGFVFHYLSQPWIRAHYEAITTGQAYPQISLTQVRDTAIPVLPVTMQWEIAASLDAADHLIAVLERLIAKKRDVRQGMMQELLTGRTRLPGFSGTWQLRRLRDLLDYEQPGRYLVSSTDYVAAGGTPVLTAGKTFLLGYTSEATGVFRKLPVVIFDDFTTASRFVTFPFKAKSSAMKMLHARPGANLRYVHERMQLINFPAVDHKRRWIAEFSKLEIAVPRIGEQEAIAAVIEETDDELAALERRLESARAVKEGMMQELLMGLTRLVSEVAA